MHGHAHGLIFPFVGAVIERETRRERKGKKKWRSMSSSLGEQTGDELALSGKTLHDAEVEQEPTEKPRQGARQHGREESPRSERRGCRLWRTNGDKKEDWRFCRELASFGEEPQLAGYLAR